jgi:hypothetical protein
VFEAGEPWASSLCFSLLPSLHDYLYRMVDHKEETLADQVLLMITFAVACMDSRSFEFCRGGRSEGQKVRRSEGHV